MRDRGQRPGTGRRQRGGEGEETEIGAEIKELKEERETEAKETERDRYGNIEKRN